MEPLLIATRNRHKLGEIRQLLKGVPCEVLDIEAFGKPLPEVDEDGSTFESNALKKARVLSKASGLATLADDSGLEVDALAGAPGVFSARFAGEPSNDIANNKKLLSMMAGVANRRARFRCVIAIVLPNGVERTVAGVCEGCLAEVESGKGGFGYDPLFIPNGFAESFAVLGDEVKQSISHRAKALALARSRWFSPLGIDIAD